MNKKDKDIYELLNEIQFDITEEEEISIDDIQKRRIKNRIKDKIKRKFWWEKKSFIAIAASIALMITLISPVGKKAIAEIKERFFYNPGLSIVNIKEEAYVLMEPILVNNDGKEVVVKSIVSSNNGVSVELYINDDRLADLSKEEIIDKEVNVSEIIKIITLDGKELTTWNSGKGGGGPKAVIYANFVSKEILREFTLKVYDLEIKNIKLEKVSEIENFEDVGFNDEDNGLIIGGNKYLFNGKTYISLWTDEEFKNNGAYGFYFDKNDIKTKNLDGNEYEVFSSDYGGQGKEIVINDEITEPINISIRKVEISYNLKKSIKATAKIPKEGEEIEINKEIYIEELDERLILKSIKNTGKEIEMYFDTGTLRKENTDIIILGAFGRSSYGIGASPDNRTITFGIYDEDLTAIEKLTGKVSIYISSVIVDRYGSWNFTIE